MKRPMQFEMSSNLREGVGLAVDATGIQVDAVSVPGGTVPEWATKLRLSPEDYGKYLLYMRDRFD